MSNRQRNSGVADPVRVAVIGLGGAGAQHLAAIRQLPFARVVAGIDVRPERAECLGVNGLSLPAALDRGVDLVAICLPPGQRASSINAAIAAGAHVLLEKPPATAPVELEDLIGRVATAHRLSAVMFQHRFALPDNVFSFDFGPATANLLVARPRANGHYTQGWRADTELAMGGVTAHLGVHYLDLACQILGPPRDIRPLSRKDLADGIDAKLSAFVSFVGGSELVIQVTSEGAFSAERLIVIGTNGWLDLTDGAVRADLGGEQLHRPARPASILRAEVYREVITAISAGAELGRTTLANSRSVTQILHALCRNQPARWP